MGTFSALLAICAGNSPVPGEFPTQRPVTRSFDVYFDLCPNERLSKHSWGWWLEMPPRPLWCHRNALRVNRFGHGITTDNDVTTSIPATNNGHTHRSMTPKSLTPTAPSCIDDIIYTIWSNRNKGLGCHDSTAISFQGEQMLARTIKNCLRLWNLGHTTISFYTSRLAYRNMLTVLV